MPPPTFRSARSAGFSLLELMAATAIFLLIAAVSLEITDNAADTALRKLTVLKDRNESEFAEYISIAKEFSIQSRLLSDDDVKSAIRECEQAGGSASMIMLGNAVFSDVPFRDAKTTRLSQRRVERLR